MLNPPCVSVTAVRVMFVSAHMAVTVAPGSTAFVLSMTVPLMAPVVRCANADAEIVNETLRARTAWHRTRSIAPPLFMRAFVDRAGHGVKKSSHMGRKASDGLVFRLEDLEYRCEPGHPQQIANALSGVEQLELSVAVRDRQRRARNAPEAGAVDVGHAAQVEHELADPLVGERSHQLRQSVFRVAQILAVARVDDDDAVADVDGDAGGGHPADRKSTRLNSSHRT